MISEYIDFEKITNLDETLRKEQGKFLVLTAQALLASKIKSRFFIWIEADIWVQDEKTLDALIKLAEKQGVGCVEHSSQKTVLGSGVYHNWDELDYQPIKDLKAYAGGLYSADKDHIFVKHLANGIIDTIEKLGYKNAREEGVFSLALHKNQSIEILPTHHHYTPFWAPGPPVLNEKDEFIHPVSKEKIGCLHVAGPWRFQNSGYLCPIKKIHPDGSSQTVQKSLWYRDKNFSL